VNAPALPVQRGRESPLWINLACQKLDRSWGGGVRKDGAAYFRGTLAFRCSALAGDLTLDCGQITPEEAAKLSHNRSAAITPP